MAEEPSPMRVDTLQLDTTAVVSYEQQQKQWREMMWSAVLSKAPADIAAQPIIEEGTKPRQASQGAGTVEEVRRFSNDDIQTIEHTLRQMVAQLLREAVKAGTPVMEYGAEEGSKVGKIPRLLDISMNLCEPMLGTGTTFLVLEDLVDCCIIPDCEKVFAYMESNRDTLKKLEAKSALNKGGKLYMLRTCNKLSKRLSKAMDTVLCGRILMFLAYMFPVTERSAANLQGKLNTSNEVLYEKEPPSEGADSDVIFQLYQTFWGLQTVFRNPLLISAGKWTSVSADLQTVLGAFEKQKLGEEEEGLAASTAEDSSGADIEGEDAIYNTKYLTSSKLFRLEMADHTFRRFFLVQVLILLRYLLGAPRNDKDKDSLTDAQRKEAVDLETQVHRMLRKLPPKGARFQNTVDQVLERENNWVLWKKDGCKPIEKSLPASHNLQPPEPKKRKRRPALGDPELARIWAGPQPKSVRKLNQPPPVRKDEVELLQEKRRKFMPDYRAHFQLYAEQLDPEAGIEPGYLMTKNKVYVWQAFRLARRFDLESFGSMNRCNFEFDCLVPDDLLPEARKKELEELDDKAQKLKIQRGYRHPNAGGSAGLALGESTGSRPAELEEGLVVDPEEDEKMTEAAEDGEVVGDQGPEAGELEEGEHKPEVPAKSQLRPDAPAFVPSAPAHPAAKPEQETRAPAVAVGKQQRAAQDPEGKTQKSQEGSQVKAKEKSQGKIQEGQLKSQGGKTPQVKTQEGSQGKTQGGPQAKAQTDKERKSQEGPQGKTPEAQQGKSQGGTQVKTQEGSQGTSLGSAQGKIQEKTQEGAKIKVQEGPQEKTHRVTQVKNQGSPQGKIQEVVQGKAQQEKGQEGSQGKTEGIQEQKKVVEEMKVPESRKAGGGSGGGSAPSSQLKSANDQQKKGSMGPPASVEADIDLTLSPDDAKP